MTWALYVSQETALTDSGDLDRLLQHYSDYDWRLRKKDDGGIEFVGLKWMFDRFKMATIKEYTTPCPKQK